MILAAEEKQTIAGIERREISSQDQYSGKTVVSKTMAYAMMKHRILNAPKVGEVAPDFSLQTTAGEKTLNLTDLPKEKPVVLIFSSWGCDIFRESLAGLQGLYEKYHDHARFVMVYTREAHPYDGFAGYLGRVNDSRTFAERMVTARRCSEQLRLPFPVLVDSIDDPVTTRWAAWPVRIFVIGTDRKVAYAGHQGPWGYRPYRGFVHGDGKLLGTALQYSNETLEEFLEQRFPSELESTSESSAAVKETK